jgi:hypothetical protein
MAATWFRIGRKARFFGSARNALSQSTAGTTA